MATNKNNNNSLLEETHTVTANDGTLVPVPEEYLCPLTMDLMMEPLLSREGHNYERDAILNWVAEHGTSPLTRQPLRPSHLVRNRTLETKINFFRKQHGIVDDASVDPKEDKPFVGYIISAKPAVEAMSLRDMASLVLGPTAPAPAHDVPSPTPTHVEARRREIADLIQGAMRDLDLDDL